MIMYFVTLMMTLILVGTMIVSTFYSKSPFNEIHEKKHDKALNTVGAGNFSYWRLAFEGRLLIEVYSISGDADIYVAEGLMPSYEADRNNLSSTTCGLDSVLVPLDFPRPFTLAVFGHWSHSNTEYKVVIHYPDTHKDHMLPHRHPLVLHNVKPEFAELIVHHLLVENPSAKKKEEPEPDPGLVRSWIFNIIGVIVELFVM